MICPSCGVQNIPAAKYCDNCGLTLPPSGSVAETPVAAHLQTAPQISLKAVFSFVSGLLFFLPFSGIGAIVLGHWSRGEIKRSAGRLRGSGFAVAGLILGYLSVALVVVFLGAIFIGNVGNVRSAFMKGANAGRVGASLGLIANAQKTYAKTYPDVGYACSLSDLGGSGGAKEHAGLIDSELASGEKYGYSFELLNCEDHKHFNVLATPHDKDFVMPRICMDETGKMFDSTKGLPAGCVKVREETHTD